MQDGGRHAAVADETTRRALREIVNRYGTPTYAFDLRRLVSQVDMLRSALPDDAQILYSLKANASLGICDVLARCGIGADVASAGELATALAAGMPPERIFVAGPVKLPDTISQLRDLPQAVLSVDSPCELRALAGEKLANPVVLRLRPDFGSCAVVPAGSESRFGFTCADLDRCRDELPASPLDVIGFHVFAGSQVLDAEKLIDHLRRSLDLCLRAADTLGLVPKLINLGGGFGIPYGPDDQPLDMLRVGDELAALGRRAAPARLALELGRYLVAPAGWYLTSVVGHQSSGGRPAVLVDGGVHQRADMCGLRLRSHAVAPLVLDGPPEAPLTPTDVWGCLSLPDDILIEASPLPPLSPGNILAFANAGAYGLWSSPALFHGHPLPAEVAFDDAEIYLMRQRPSAESILAEQRHVIPKTHTAHA